MNSLIQPEFQIRTTDLSVKYKKATSNDGGFYKALQMIDNHFKIGRDLGSFDDLPIIYKIHEKNSSFHIAYPSRIFEPGNIPQMLSIISMPNNIIHGETFIVTDIIWPNTLLAHFSGSKWNIKDIQTHHIKQIRNISCGKLMPDLYISTKNCLEKAYQIWTGGCDMVMESPFINSKDIFAFHERISFVKKERDACKKRTKQQKYYIPNITGSDYEDCHQRLNVIKQEQLSFCCINEEVGISCISSILREAIMNDISIFVIQTNRNQTLLENHILVFLYRLMGATGVQIFEENKKSVSQLQSLHIHNRFPYASCIPIIDIMENLMEIEEKTKKYGNELIFIGSKQIYMHPDGIRAGSNAFHNTICAASKGINQKNAAKQHESIQRALKNEQILPKKVFLS